MKPNIVNTNSTQSVGTWEKSITSAMVGFGGASSSGKTKIINSILYYLGRKDIGVICLDGYHKHGRQTRKNIKEFPEQIEANHFDRLCSDLAKLKSSISINVPLYDHKKGILEASRKLHPKLIYLIEGLHGANINQICNSNTIDCQILLDTESNLRKSWKVKRDIETRYYNYGDVIDEISKRRQYVNNIIYTQQKSSDIIIRIFRESPIKQKIYIKDEFINAHQYLKKLLRLIKDDLPLGFKTYLNETHLVTGINEKEICNFIKDNPFKERITYAYNEKLFCKLFSFPFTTNVIVLIILTILVSKEKQ